jgi:predicted dehydrogenase
VPRHSVLVVGVGSIGERHVRCFAKTGRAEVRLVEINPELRRTIAERYTVDRSYGSLDDALHEPPSAAVIATPAPHHIAQATALARAGVHVLIEKPLGTSLEGFEALEEAVRDRGVVAGVAYVYRCHPLLRALRSVLLEGRFGRPVEVVTVSGQHFPLYRPAYRTIYYNDRAMGGGAIQDALTHLINAVEWLVGPVDRLVADAAHQVLDGVNVEDTAHVLARHGRVLASYSLNQHQPPSESTLTVVCDRGAVRGEFHAQRWRWAVEPGEPWHDEPIAPVERDDPFVAQAHAFLDAVEGQAPIPCSLGEGAQTLRVNLAALASLESRTWQEIGAEPLREC